MSGSLRLPRLTPIAEHFNDHVSPVLRRVSTFQIPRSGDTSSGAGVPQLLSSGWRSGYGLEGLNLVMAHGGLTANRLCLPAFFYFSHQEVGCVLRVPSPRGLPGTGGSGDMDFKCQYWEKSRYSRTNSVLGLTKHSLLYIQSLPSRPSARCRQRPGRRTKQTQCIPAAGVSGHNLHAHSLGCWGQGTSCSVSLFLCFPLSCPSEQA